MRTFNAFFFKRTVNRPFPILGTLTRNGVLCCGDDNDNSHQEDNQYHGGGSYDGW